MMSATGMTRAKLALNFSFILHPCVCVADMVVSLMNERLSPKKAPPTTIATMRGREMSLSCAMPTATGVSAATVPTDVPMASEMKQEARKMPGMRREAGRRSRVRLTVASTAPMVLAEAAKAPARM